MKYWIALLLISVVSFVSACLYRALSSEVAPYHDIMPLLAIISMLVFIICCIALGGGNYGGRKIEECKGFDDAF